LLTTTPLTGPQTGQSVDGFFLPALFDFVATGGDPSLGFGSYIWSYNQSVIVMGTVTAGNVTHNVSTNGSDTLSNYNYGSIYIAADSPGLPALWGGSLITSATMNWYFALQVYVTDSLTRETVSCGTVYWYAQETWTTVNGVQTGSGNVGVAQVVQ
jgi:hypothetical protein